MKNKRIRLIVILIVILLAGFFIFRSADSEGRKYSIEKVVNYNYFVLQENEKCGVIDKSAAKILEPKFQNVVIPNPSKDVFICTSDNGETKAINAKNQDLFTNYEEVTSIRLKNVASDLMYEKSVLKYKKNGKYGLIDYTGKQITDAIYEQIESLESKEGELVVQREGKFGVINIKGNILVPIEYATINIDEYYTDENQFKDAGYIVGVKTDEGYRYGYIDIEGKEVLKTEYNEIYRVNDIKDGNNLYFVASKKGRFGLYKNENQIINNEYQSISYNKGNNIFLLERSKKFGISNIEGNIIVEVKYAQIDINGKYLYANEKGDETIVLDANGNKVDMSANISKISVADGKYLIVISNEENKTLYGIEDAQEVELVKKQYTYLEYLFDNYFMACNTQGYLGIINDVGMEIVELKYNSIQKIGESKLIQATLENDAITEIYSPTMSKRSEMKNASVAEINGYVKLYNDEESIYISGDGEIVDNKEVYKDNKLFAVKKNGVWGFEDVNENIVVECKYDKVTEFNKYGFAGIKQDGKWGVIDSNSNIVLEPKYEFEGNAQPDFLGSNYKVSYGLGEFYYTNK